MCTDYNDYWGGYDSRQRVLATIIMTHHAIRIEGLSKRFRLGQQGRGVSSLREAITAGVRSIVGTTRDKNDKASRDLWALRGLSCDIPAGQAVGVIGHNGAGKSTLLKVLSEITSPTEGRVEVTGRLASLLEVGTGFHPELTGRENIYLNGAILGMTRREISSKFDDIVAFAEVDRFLDTPVKRYSSGMYTRLAFAVAAHLEPDILVVDEVLAVGDAAFQKKCLGKMSDVAHEGRTVLFVSHNMGAIRSLCDRAILLERGKLMADGTPDEVIDAYLDAGANDTEHDGELFFDGEQRPGDDQLRLTQLRLLGPSGRPQSAFTVTAPIQIEIGYEVLRPIRGMRVNLQLLTHDGQIAFTTCDQDAQISEMPVGEYRSVCTVPSGLLNLGAYCVSISAGIPGVKRFLAEPQKMSFVTTGASNGGSSFPEAWPGVVCPALSWQVESNKPMVMAG